MKKTAITFLFILCSFVVNGQVGGCSNQINSLVFTPITGTNDIELSIISQCCDIHNFYNFAYTNNTPNHTITVCYLDTGLLMPSTITSSIILSNANNSVGDQNFAINSFFNYFNSGLPCDSSLGFNEQINITLTTPLIQQRTFLSSENDFYIKKISLSPNPNSGVFSIDLPTDTDPVQLSISDLSGKKVFTTDNYLSGKILQLNELSKGLYFVTINYNKSTETLKFIVN